MNDNFFGELVYDGGWVKKERISIWGKDNDVKIVVSAYENETPNNAQQNAYITLKKDLNKISETTLKELKKYVKIIEDDVIAYSGIDHLPEDIFDLVSISELLFVESGAIGIMCNAKWDSHGIAVLYSNDTVEVGPQDIVWSEGF